MTTYWGESDAGQPGTGPDPDEITLLLQRVRDGLLRQPAETSSDESEVAA